MTVDTKMQNATHTLLELDDIYDMIYPVGSIRIIQDTLVNTDPILNHDGTQWRNTTFQIMSAKNLQYRLDISSGIMQDGQNVDIYTKNNTTAQQWWLYLHNDGTVFTPFIRIS